MNSIIHKLYSHLIKYNNLKKFLNLTKNHIIYSYNFKPAMLSTRAVLKRPKELDNIGKRIKINEEYDCYKNSGSTEKITFHGYFLISIPIITFGLGTWQIERRKWKLELIKSLEERLSREPVDLPENLSDLSELDYCPIKVRGKFLYDKEFVIGPKTLIVNGQGASEGKAGLISGSALNKGYNIITPLKLQDRDTVILVNRGWLPHKYKDLAKRKKFQREGIIELIGINRNNEIRPQFVIKNNPQKSQWNYRDIYEMAAYANTEPVFLDMIKSDSTESGLQMPIPGQTRVHIRNEHLSYIITWYGLSAFTGFYCYRMFVLGKSIF